MSTKTQTKSCRTCGFAVWARTASGRMSGHLPGRCGWTPPEPPFAPVWAEIRRVGVRGNSIWPKDPYTGCAVWKPIA